jgi:hypothetical protein
MAVDSGALTAAAKAVEMSLNPSGRAEGQIAFVLCVLDRRDKIGDLISNLDSNESIAEVLRRASEHIQAKPVEVAPATMRRDS